MSEPSARPLFLPPVNVVGSPGDEPPGSATAGAVPPAAADPDTPVTGEQYRAALRRTDWILSASPHTLRNAVHALCWRCSRSILTDICSDPRAAAAVLATARGVLSELETRLERASAGSALPGDRRPGSRNDAATSLRRRRSSARTIIASTSAATEAQRMLDELRADSDDRLAELIAEHRRAVIASGAVREADEALWRGIADHTAELG